MLNSLQVDRINLWVTKNARAYDLAKWNYIINNEPKDNIVKELIRYQNLDGGFGHGFECDIISPVSTAISTAEAIYQTYEYYLDTKAEWFTKMLSYFENTVMNIPKYWEDVPKKALDYPHAPWWNYELCTTFSPNPCGVVASALILYGTETQKQLGYKIAEDCFQLLVSNDFCGDHDTLNILTLVNRLMEIKSTLITDQIISAMKRRISENVCFDSSLWNEYRFQPLDFIDNPSSFWYDCVKQGVEENLQYWISSINEQGVWNPNFSWGTDSDISRQVTENWKGYIAVKRVRILKNFSFIQ